MEKIERNLGLIVEKVVKPKCGHMYKILEIHSYCFPELPFLYLQGLWCAVAFTNEGVLYNSGGYEIGIGMLYTPHEFEEITAFLQICAERLEGIYNEIKERSSYWQGRQVLTIKNNEK